MMPPGLSAILMVVMVTLVGGELAVVDDSNWWESCKTPVCTVAENQAEGLARLRVLSNYIKETMTLMGTVVASLENEMTEVGQELRSIVGRRCHARGHIALSTLVTHLNQTQLADNDIVEVSTDDDDSWTSASDIAQESTSTWSSDVDAMGGSSSTSHRPGRTSHGTSRGTSQRPGSASYSTHQTMSSTSGTWRGSSQYPSSTLQTTSRHHDSDSHISATRSSGSLHSSSATSHSTGKTLHQRPRSTLKKYQAPTEEIEPVYEYVAPSVPQTIDRQRGRGRGRQGSEHGPGHGKSRGHGWGRGHGGGRGHGRGSSASISLGNSGSLGLDASECMGVPPGSPHYVPGLDSWCAANCPVGNCPATHCVC